MSVLARAVARASVLERGEEPVRLTRTLDVRAGTVATSYASSRGEVIEQVAGWLDDVAAGR